MTRDEAAAKLKKERELDLKRTRLREALALCAHHIEMLNLRLRVVRSMTESVHETIGCSFIMEVDTTKLVRPNKKKANKIKQRLYKAALEEIESILMERVDRWQLWPFAFIVKDASGGIIIGRILDGQGKTV